MKKNANINALIPAEISSDIDRKRNLALDWNWDRTLKIKYWHACFTTHLEIEGLYCEWESIRDIHEVLQVKSKVVTLRYITCGPLPERVHANNSTCQFSCDMDTKITGQRGWSDSAKWPPSNLIVTQCYCVDLVRHLILYREFWSAVPENGCEKMLTYL